MKQLQLVAARVAGEKEDLLMMLSDVEDIARFIINDRNYGMFRQYEIDGSYYTDCGPITLITSEKLFQ